MKMPYNQLLSLQSDCGCSIALKYNSKTLINALMHLYWTEGRAAEISCFRINCYQMQLGERQRRFESSRSTP